MTTADVAIWKLPKVKQQAGLGRSEIYRRMRRGDFPQSVKLGARAVGWLSDEIQDWITERIRQSRNGTAR